VEIWEKKEKNVVLIAGIYHYLILSFAPIVEKNTIKNINRLDVEKLTIRYLDIDLGFKSLFLPTKI